MSGIANASVERIHRDALLAFSPGALPDGIPAPAVTLGLDATDPEPFHVLTWETARAFTSVGMLTGGVVEVTFEVWMTLVASGDTREAARTVADAYLERAVQITLCDTTLGGNAVEVGWPQIAESDAWADASGRKHCGYLVKYEVSTYATADPAVRALIGE